MDMAAGMAFLSDYQLGTSANSFDKFFDSGCSGLLQCLALY